MRQLAAEREASLKNLYIEQRRAAYALAMAGSGLEEASYDAVKRGLIAAGKRIGRRRFDPNQLLKQLSKLKRAQTASAALSPAFLQLDDTARRVWALKHGSSLDDQAASSILRLHEQEYQEALKRAEAALGPDEAADFNTLLDNMMSRREIWSEVSYELSRQLRLSRYLRIALSGLVACVLLFLLAREGWMGLKILQLSKAGSSHAISESYESPDFYKRFPESPSSELPRMNARLHDRLKALDDAQQLRVAFRFYDSSLFQRITEDGDSLMSLYTAMYDEGLKWGKLHRLMANAISLYYSNYERPFLPAQRSQDFKSNYASIYDAAKALSTGSEFRHTAEAFPDFFKDREGFESYLYSNYFMGGIVPGVYQLLSLEKALSPALREDYERSVFAFTNPNGMMGKLDVDGFHFFKEPLARFFALREKLGKAGYQQLVARLKQLLPNSELSSDILEGNESSLFSATLSKQEILKLAKDDARFYFLGVAAPRETGYPARMEHGLTELAVKDLMKPRQVYQIDEEFLQHSINFAAPLRLPQGFIDELRQARACKDTQFEFFLRYDYHMRFAHPQQRTGYGLLRAIYGNPALQFASADFKSFTHLSF